MVATLGSEPRQGGGSEGSDGGRGGRGEVVVEEVTPPRRRLHRRCPCRRWTVVVVGGGGDGGAKWGWRRRRRARRERERERERKVGLGGLGGCPDLPARGPNQCHSITGPGPFLGVNTGWASGVFRLQAAAGQQIRLALAVGFIVFSGERGDLYGGAVEGMDAQSNWRGGTAASRLSYKNATIAVCAFNLLVAALLLHNYHSSWTRIPGGDQFDSGMLP